jgi:hypothetical protein
MLKLIEGNQYETTAGTFYFIGISRNDFTCDVCHKQHYDHKRQEYQNFYEFTDTNDGSFSQHYLIGTTCIRKFIKIQNAKLQRGNNVEPLELTIMAMLVGVREQKNIGAFKE